MLNKIEDYRIAFVNLRSPLPVMSATSRFTYEHLGIEYLTSVLRQQNYSVKIIDAQVKNLSEDEIIKEICDFNPAFIGFSPISITFESAVRIAKAAKQLDNNIHICVGGQLATFAAEDILKNVLFFDSAVRGYGEETIVEAVDRLYFGKSLENVEGIYYKDQNGEIIKNSERPKNKNINTIPFPARDSLEWQLRNGGPSTARIITSRGCFFNCSFCSTPAFEKIQAGPLWCARSAENVLDELVYLKEHFNITTVLFSDDNIIGPGNYGTDRVRNIAEGIIEKGLGINFRILCRAEALLDKNAELISLLKRAGLERVIVGIESGCPAGLKLLNKKTTVNQNLKAAKLLTKNDVALEAGFIMFHPYVTFEELKENASFLKKIDQVSFYRLTSRLALYNGAPLINRLKQDNLLNREFDYRSPFGYKFQDQMIGVLADSFGKLGSWFYYENMEGTLYDWEMQSLDVDFFLSNAKNKTIWYKELEEDILSEFRNNYLSLRSEVGSLNLQFFINCVELAENGWNISSFIKLKDKYIQDIKNANKKLRKMCKGILRVF